MSKYFMRSKTPGNGGQLHTPLGIFKVENEHDEIRVENDVIEKMTKRLGRAPTRAELISGPKAADDRTTLQKMEREEWQPKRPPVDPMDALADSLEGVTSPDYSGMSLNERLAADARAIANRNRSGNEVDEQKATRLKLLAGDLRKIDEAISDENWRAERGSQRIVDLLEMTREQLVNGSDAAETRRLRGEFQSLLAERAKTEDAAGRAAIAELNRQIELINDGRKLSSVGEDDPIRFRAEELMAEGQDSTSAWYVARQEAAESAGEDTSAA